MTLGEVISAACIEWRDATGIGRDPEETHEFTVGGRPERIGRFDVLLLCRLAENGFGVHRYHRMVTGPGLAEEALIELETRGT